jgi:hypothetical protein
MSKNTVLATSNVAGIGHNIRTGGKIIVSNYPLFLFTICDIRFTQLTDGKKFNHWLTRMARVPDVNERGRFLQKETEVTKA